MPANLGQQVSVSGKAGSIKQQIMSSNLKHRFFSTQGFHKKSVSIESKKPRSYTSLLKLQHKCKS
jgi:hypothetical protein